MAEAQLSVRPAESTRSSIGERRHELARTLQAKIAQGYRVESQTDTKAVLRMGTRRRWFGVCRDPDNEAAGGTCTIVERTG